jgi:type 1 glutamine amidotransferase
MLAGLLVILVFAPRAGVAATESVLVFSRTTGFRHGPPIEKGNAILKRLAEELGYTCHTSEDPSVFDPNNVTKWDLIIFNNTSGKNCFEGQERRSAFMARIKGGAGFMGFHGAAECLEDWPEYRRMLNCRKQGQPWNQEVRSNIEVPDHPLMRPFRGRPFQTRDEIFEFRDYDRTAAKVLMSLHHRGLDMRKGKRKDGDYAVCWIRKWDNGRVYYNCHGHYPQVFENTVFQEHIKVAMRWAIGELKDVDVSPSPILDREAIGKKALADLRLATRDDDRITALYTLTWCPVEGGLEVVEPLLKGKQNVAAVAAEAAKALCEHNKYLTKDRRVEVLKAAFAAATSPGLRKIIRESLRRLGVRDISANYTPGYVFVWLVAGPIPDSEGDPLKTKFPPEKEIDVINGFEVGGRRYVWRLAVGNEDGILDLIEAIGQESNCAVYMYSEILVDKAQDVELRFGSDDGFIAWLNGTEVARFASHRAIKPGSERVKVRLNAGANQLLMKVAQVSGDWAGCAQIVATDGGNVEFTTRKKW